MIISTLTLGLVRKLDGLDFNSHIIRLSFLLQDMLTFIWTGSVQSLMHPSLFSRYKQRESLLIFGHFFIDPALLKLSMDFDKIQLHLPVLNQHRITEDDDQIDELDVLTLPRKMIYALFPNVNDQEQLESLMGQIRLCLHSSGGVVSPPEKNVGWVMASNLVNSFFASIFTTCGINDAVQQKQFINSLQRDEASVRSLFKSLGKKYKVTKKCIYIFNFFITFFVVGCNRETCSHL